MPRQAPPFAESYNASLDWITLSASTEPRRNVTFQRHALELLETMKSAGAKEERFGIQGYEGEKFEGVAVGVRASDGHTVLAAHGRRTDSIAQWAIENEIDAICKRLDPAMTIQYRAPIPYYGAFLNRRTREFEEKKGLKTRKPFTLFEKAKQDTGAYLGSRSSAIFLRVYDDALYHTKKTDFTSWKHELELKGVAALHAWGQFKVSDNRSELCAEWVTTRLKKHGICPRGVEKLNNNPLAGTKEVSEFDTWLEWVGRSACDRMKREMLEGHGPEILEMLIKKGILRPNGYFSMPTLGQEELELEGEF